MSQIGTPQKNILEPIASDYPSTTPAAAGKSAIVDGQLLVDDANQLTGGRAGADPSKIAPPYTEAVMQPDLPPLNAEHVTITSSPVFSSGTTGGAFDVSKSAVARAISGSIDPALIENETVLAAPKSGGSGTGYGAFSGGTPGGAVTASLVVQDLTYTAKAPGLQGNGVKIAYIAGGVTGSEVVTVDFPTELISVSMHTTASTAAMIRAAVLASSDAMSLLASVAVSGTGSNTQVAAAAANLTGGANTPGDGDGALTNTKGSFSAINRSGARNHAAINVIARPGDNQNGPFVS